MDVIDLVKEHPELYRGKAEWKRITVRKRTILAVSGEGNPNDSPDYLNAFAALYGLVYTIKFSRKKAGQQTFKVAPIEGLWWADDFSAFSEHSRYNEWKWTMFIPVPDFVTEQDLADAKVQLGVKHLETDTSKALLDTLDEGECVQYLWVGRYDREFEVLEPLHNGGLEAMGLVENGDHHEIYLSDPRRVEPEKLKTLLRQPVRPR